MPLFNVTPAAIFSDVSAALGILTSSAAVDIVGVFDSESLAQVFVNARPLKGLIREESRTMEHPVEKGSIIADHRIIVPVEIYFPMMVNAAFYGSVYNEMKGIFNNATLLSVQTRVGVYRNMFIAGMPHEETPDQYDAITIALHLKEVLYSDSTTIYAPEPPTDANPNAANLATKVSNGQVAPKAAVIPQTDPGTYNEYLNPGGWS